MDKILILNRAREKHRIQREIIIRQNAKDAFLKYKSDINFIVGVALYWAEGKKTKRETSILDFCNSDPDLLETYCGFLRKYFDLNGHSIKARLFLYPDLSEDDVKSFWSKKLSIPEENFIKSVVLTSRAQVTKNKLEYGTCSVYVIGKKFRLIVDTWIGCLISARR